MVGTCLLLGLLTVATVTDLRWGKVYNWTTYPGMLLALAASAAVTVAQWQGFDGGIAEDELARVWGIVPLLDGVVGLFVCGLAMLVCYVSFPGGVGGGDIKLVAMIGAFLGLYAGLEAMLWTFVIGGALALIVLVWRFGLWQLARRAWRMATYLWRAGPAAELSDEERQPLKAGLYLAPSAALAVVIVRFRLIEWF